jgi:hypothetical protein
MTRDLPWLTFLSVALIATACALYRDGSVVGGATPDTTSVPCPDGSRCPNYAPLCPQYPGERCQADTPDIEHGARPWDAGSCANCIHSNDGSADEMAHACRDACR